MSEIEPCPAQRRALGVSLVLAVTGLAACGSLLGVASIVIVESVGDAGPDASSSVSPAEEPEDESATMPSTPPEVGLDATPPPELDATIPETGPDAASPCEGKADGLAPNPATPLVRCCRG